MRLPADFWRSSFARLYLSGWLLALAMIVLGMTISVLLFGLWMPYWKVADQDMILAAEALSFNAGKPQLYFDHTGYLSDLVLAAWYRVLHVAGILRAHALSTLPSPGDATAYDRAWQGLIMAGRVHSLLLGALFVWSFAALVRRLVGDWRVAVLAALALAYSGSFLWHIRTIRTELLSAGLVTAAILLVLVAARDARPRRHLMLAAASLCATLAVVAKVQALVPTLTIPVLALAFRQSQPQGCDDDSGAWRRWIIAASAIVLAAVVAWPAVELLRVGIAEVPENFGYRPLGGGLSGVYQWLIAASIVCIMIAYAVLWRIGVADTLAAVVCVALGAALGLLSMRIHYDVRNVIAVAHPIEHLFRFAALQSPALSGETQVLSPALLGALANGIARALAVHSFIFAPTGRPTVLVEWFAIAGIVVLWRRGERTAAMQAALLILAAWGIDAVFSLRNLLLYYFVYTDPLLIVAAAIVLAHWPEAARSPRVHHAALGLLAVTIVWGHLEPVRQAVTRGQPQQACEWLPLLRQVGPFSICRS